MKRVKNKKLDAKEKKISGVARNVVCSENNALKSLKRAVIKTEYSLKRASN